MTNSLQETVVTKVAVKDFKYSKPIMHQLQHQIKSQHISLDGIWNLMSSEKTRKLIVSYLTSGDINTFFSEFDIRDVNDYLIFSEHFNFTAVKNLCENELLSQLQPCDSIKYLQIARAFRLTKLESKCLRFIEIHFETLSRSEEFQYIGENDLFDLMQNSVIAKNPCVDEALKHWYSYEPGPRRSGYEKIHKVLDEKKSMSYKNIKQITRKQEHQYIVMFTCDKYDYKAKPSAVIMEADTFTWTKIYLDKIGNCGPEFSVCLQQDDVTHKPYVYFTGGKEKSSRRVFRGDAILGKWKRCPNMKESRSRHCTVTINKNVYVLGGYQDIQGKNVVTIEEYSCHSKWRVVGNLIHGVRSAGCAVFDKQIYVFGGVLEDRTVVPYIQRFDPITQEVKVVSSLPEPCSCCKVVVVDNLCYIISVEGHVIRFNPKTGICHTMSSHPLKIRHFALFTDGQDIFTAGGCYGDYTCIKDIYKYRTHSDSWEKLNYALPDTMAVYGSCSVTMQEGCNLVPLIKFQ